MIALRPIIRPISSFSSSVDAAQLCFFFTAAATPTYCLWFGLVSPFGCTLR